MDARPVDPRDTAWENRTPTYRVYFWDGGASDEWELSEVDAPEVIAWADRRAAETNQTYVVFVATRNQSGPGLIRLCGWEEIPTFELPGEGGRPHHAVSRPLR